MNTGNIIKELTKYAGLTSIGAGAILFLWKMILNPIYTRYLDHRLRQAELHEKTFIDIQDKMFSKKLEVETIKLNRVLPGLEEINLQIANHRMMYTTYVHACVNNEGLRPGLEDMRLEADKKIINEIYKISIYLPPEMRMILNELRRMVSCSWKNPQEINRTIKQSIFNKQEILDKALDLYSVYHDCFYEMVYNYCSIGDVKLDYTEILEKYHIDEDGEYKHQDILVKFINLYLLFAEYYSKENRDLVLEKAFNE